MNYQEFINNIIQTRGQWNIIGYYEKHHILPKCLGGKSDYKNGKFKPNSNHPNCIWLTAQEHFIAHKLLMQEYPESIELKNAYCAMALWKSPSQERLYEVSSEEYEEARLLSNELNKKYHIGKKYSEETINKRREKMIGQKRTKETRQNMSEAAKRFYKNESEEHRAARISNVSKKTKEAMWSDDVRKNYLKAYYSPEARQKQKDGLKAFYESEKGQELKKQVSDRLKISAKETMKKIVPLYKKYKELGGNLKWNDFRSQYSKIGDEIFNEINRRS